MIEFICMKKVDQHLMTFTADLFSFSYALIPDELQAQQIVTDALTVLVLRHQELIENIFVGDADTRERKDRFIKVALFESTYSLASKRERQLNIGKGEESLSFYLLPVESRALLFLTYKTNFTQNEYADILSRDKYEVAALNGLARIEADAFICEGSCATC